MAVAIEMEHLISLSTLPVDIIRKVIGMEAESVDAMRLISRSWHSLSSGITPPAPPLERVYLCTNISRAAYEESWKRVHMRAIFPKRYSGRAGVGNWLDIVNKYRDSVEVACRPVRIVNDIDVLQIIKIMAVSLWAAIAFLSAWLIPLKVINATSYLLIVLPRLSLLAAAGAGIARAIAYYAEGRKRKARARFARFFGMFTRIERLVLHNFQNQKPVFEALKKALKGVQVNQLEIRDFRVDEYFRSEIIELCRVHNIRNVFITTSSMGSIASFARDLCTLGVALDIYERSNSDDASFFNTSFGTWNQIATNLRPVGLTMRMRTAFDVSVGHKEYPFGIKSHIRCEKTEDATQKMTPVKISRGFKFN